MACLYTHNGKTYTKEELVEYLKNNPNIYNIKPDFSNINDIINNVSQKVEIGVEEFKDAPKEIAEKLRTLKTNSKIIKLTPDGKNYVNTLTGRLYKRVTSVFKDSPEDSDLLTSASTIGTKIDTLVRDFFSNNLKSDISGYGILSKTEYDSFIKQLEGLKKKFEASGETVIADDILVYNDEVGVAGTVDLLTYDKQGNIRIYDMKTMRGNNFIKDNYGQTKYDSTAVFEKTGELKPDGSPKYRVVSGKTQDSKREQHSKQLSLYRILLNNTNGLEASELFILPIAVDYNAKDTSTKSAELLPTVKLKIQDSVKDIKFKPEFKEAAKVTEKKVLSNQTIKRLNNLIQNQIKLLQGRILEFESAKERKGYLPKEDTINRLKDLKEKLSTLENIDAFTNTADFIHHELGVTEDFLDNTFDINNENHIHFVLQIRKQLEFYKEFSTFTTELSNLSSDVKKIVDEVNLMYKNTQDRVEEILEEYMVNFVKTNTKKDISKEDIKKMLDESKDISWQEMKMGGLSNSMDPLLQLLQRHVEKTREEVYENTNNWIAKVKNQVTKLKNAGITGFDWMFQKTKDGKLTGRILQRVNEVYYKDRTAIFNTLKDANGDKREYIYKPGETLSDAEKQHNLKFAEDKKKVGTFLSAETIDNTGVRDGEHHKYSDEFKQERSNFETLVTYESGYSTWVKKPYVEGTKKLNGEDLTRSEYERLYTAYKRKYYTELQESFRLKSVYNNATKQYDYDGTVERTEISRVKPEYVEVVTEINGATTKYADKQYHALMNDKTPAGIARKEFFEFYKNTSNELLNKLPLATKQKMQGKMFRVRSSIAKDIKTIGVFNTVKKSIREYVNPDVIFTSRELDEEGNMLEDVPIFYTGELKSNKKIEQLTKKLEELRKELQTNAKDKSLTNKIKMTKNLLLIEESKLTPDELELDMGKSLIKAAQMAENYDLMKQAEATLLIAKKVIEQKNFFKLNAANQKEIIKGIDSNVNKRMNSYMRMIFYSNSSANQDKISKLIQNFNGFVAYKSLGLNPFSAINNTVMAKINNRIEGFGKQFGFTNKHLNSAIADTAEYIRSLSYMKNLGKDEYLLEPTNKFEAMLKKFNWIDKNQIIEDSSAISKLMFLGITGGEFIAQSNTAIAKLRSEVLTNSKTGEKLSVWEAHEFVNGELKLKDGFEYSPQQKRSMSVDIKNMNKMIHGNYSENDKVAMQEHALGQSAMQFKKWVYNFAKSRYGNTYYDETSGDYQEGRYRTFKDFIMILKAGAKFDFDTIKSTFNSLEDYQKSNLKKLQVEALYWVTSVALMLLLEGLSKGIDDDDEELKMLVNFLRKQSDRVGGELDAAINPKSIAANIKNPVSGIRAVSDFGDIIVELVKLPYNYAGDSKDLYVKKGPNKGQLRLNKEIQDVIPIANLEHQFDNLLTSGNFYFK